MSVLEEIIEDIEEYLFEAYCIEGDKNIEKIVNSHSNEIPKCGECSRRKFYQVGFNDGFNAQPEKWTPLSSGKLPPENEDVLITYVDKNNSDDRNVEITQYGERFLGTFSIGKKWIPPFEYFDRNYKIVAWRPLSEPYKGKLS